LLERVGNQPDGFNVGNNNFTQPYGIATTITVSSSPEHRLDAIGITTLPPRTVLPNVGTKLKSHPETPPNT
jgi:hypothetical protein